MVRIPPQIALPWEGEQAMQILIDHIFPQLDLHGWDASYMVERAIITPTNDDVQKLNDIIINLSGDEHNLFSFDEVEGDTHDLYQHEFLNSIAKRSIPPHILKVKKKGAPLMLLRNIDPIYGMCNGTWLLCRGLFKNMLDVEILT